MLPCRSLLLLLLLLGLQEVQPEPVMWQKRLNPALFPHLSRVKVSCPRVLLLLPPKVYSDCSPGFLCINLGDQEQGREKEPEQEQEQEQEFSRFFQPASSIVPRREGRELMCQTHTARLEGQCWVICDNIRLWECDRPLVRSVGELARHVTCDPVTTPPGF